ncbi:MAG: hypothetical protein QNM02_00745, partial [Acidimicrobiia bacterium]|nr:hypothetical protein [Acidimicrobiia bacterium]
MSSLTRFLGLVTKEWVAYGSEGISLRDSVHAVAGGPGGRAPLPVDGPAPRGPKKKGGRSDTKRKRQSG